MQELAIYNSVSFCCWLRLSKSALFTFRQLPKFFEISINQWLLFSCDSTLEFVFLSKMPNQFVQKFQNKQVQLASAFWWNWHLHHFGVVSICVLSFSCYQCRIYDLHILKYTWLVLTYLNLRKIIGKTKLISTGSISSFRLVWV